jgi:hypothetical protein
MNRFARPGLDKVAGASSGNHKKTARNEEWVVEVEQELEARLGAAGAEEVDLEAVAMARRRRGRRVRGRSAGMPIILIMRVPPGPAGAASRPATSNSERSAREWARGIVPGTGR